MLVLSRRIGEEIIIGDTIRVSLLMVDGNRVKLGIAAPDQISILRSELLAENPKGADRHRTRGERVHEMPHV